MLNHVLRLIREVNDACEEAKGIVVKELPEQSLNPKIKTVWRINDALWITVIFLCSGLVPFIFMMDDTDPELQSVGCVLGIVLVVLYVVMLIVFLVILPPIRYARWKFDLNQDYLDIARGIIWRKRFIIPFIRVQNTDTRQGPILRMFGLASVTVSTAAGAHEIPGLDETTAESLRDRAAEFARLAREDV